MYENKYVPEIIAEKIFAYYQEGFDPLFEEGQAIQEAVLKDIIALSKGSKYAVDHGFLAIDSIQDFRAMVPISEYGDYYPYIQDNLKVDRCQITCQETDHYLLSTGRERQGKYYIETRLGSLARQLSINLWNMNLTKLEPEMTQPDVKMLAVTNCSPLENAPNGKAVRRTSGQAAKELWEHTPDLYVFPYEFLEADMTNDARDYLTALYVLKERGFNMLFCNNLAYFGVLLDQIEQHAEKMIEDIREGVMSVPLSEHDREILESAFIADAARADELQTILEKERILKPSSIWPDFVFTGAWLAGTVGDYSKDVMRKLPKNMRYLSESYGCSEAMINLPLSYNAKYGPLAVYSCYFEFLPLQGGELLTMAEVKDGEYYELVISTYSGLYRYNLHDIVRIHGFTGTTANVEFCCRSSESLKLKDRMFYGYEFSDFVADVEKMLQINIDFYQAKESAGKLTLIFQTEEKQKDLQQVSQMIEVLATSKKIILDAIYWVDKAYRMMLYQDLMNNGRTIQCIKLPMIAKWLPDTQYIEYIYVAQDKWKERSSKHASLSTSA